MAMAMTPETETAAAWDAHPYYQLLPSYVSRSSIEAERRVLFQRVEDLCERLARIYAGNEDEGEGGLELRHLQDVGICFSLKHELPLALHARLLRALMDLLWRREGCALRSIDLEVQALKVLEISLRQWKKRVVRGGETTSEDVDVDWRVVKRAAERACFRGNNCFRRGAEMPVMELVQSTMGSAEEARTLFRSRDASFPMVTELWNEFGPSIKNLTSIHSFRDMAFFSLFFVLPVAEREVARKEVARLLPEWFATWSMNSQNPEWDGHWLKVMSRLAKVYQDPALWKPYLPFIFAKVHDFLDFPSDLGDAIKTSSWPPEYSAINGSKDPVGYAMRLCVFLLSDEAESSVSASSSPSQRTLELLAVMKAFFHPSNVANVADSLGIALGSYTTALAKRLGREKALPDPSRRTLSLETCRPLLTAITDMALMGIYSKSRSVATKCMNMIEVMICIDPAHCASPVLENMMNALDPLAMSHSHLAASAISSMAVFLYHLMYGKRPDTTGVFFSTYLIPILKLTLPGIDPSDDSKTISTISLYYQLLSWLPIVNDSTKGNFKTTKSRGVLSKQLFKEMEGVVFASLVNLDEETDQKLWELGSFLEEWCLEVLDRCLQFLKSRSRDMESSSHGSRREDAAEDEAAREVVSLLALLYPQMSPAIYDRALRKTVEFLNDIFLSSPSGGKLIARLIYKSMQGNPGVAFKQLFAIVLGKFRVTKTSIDVSTLTTSEKIWNLYLLNGMVRFNDPDDRFLLHYRDELRVILNHFLTKEEDKEVYEVASRVLQHLLVALFGVYTHDFRSLPREQWLDAVSSESGAFQYLGVSVSWKRLSISWHEPNGEELAFGFQLLQEHLVAPLDELEGLESSKDTTVKSWSNRLNRVLSSVRGASSILVDGASAPSENALLNGAMPLLKSALGENEELLGRFAALKSMVMARVHELVSFWRSEGAGGAVEIPLLRSLLRIIAQLLLWRGKSNSEFRMKERQSKFAKKAAMDAASYAFQKALRRKETGAGVVDPLVVASRNDKVEMVNFFNDLRCVQQHFALANAIFQNQLDDGIKRNYENLLGDVEGLFKHAYEPVRAEAAQIMQDTHELYAKWLYTRLPSLVEELHGSSSSTSEELREETASGVVFALTLTLSRRNMWGRRDGLLGRVLQVLLKSDEVILNRVDGEASKAKVNAKLQTYFMMLLASWRSIDGHRRGTNGDSVLQQLIQAEPGAAAHWKFQLMHLVMLYPFLQPEASPLSMELWSLVIRQMRSDVLPVRQIALLLFALLVKLHKHESRQSGSTGAVDALLYSNDTLKAVVASIFDNYKNSNQFAASADGQHAESAPSNWSFGVNDVIRHLSAGPNSFPKSPFLSSVRVMNQANNSISQVSLSTAKLVEKLVLINPSLFFASGVVEVLSDMASERIDVSAALEDRQAALSTLADWIAGIVHALLKVESSLSEQEVANQLTTVVELLKKILPSLSVVLIDQWTQVLYLASRPSKHRGVKLQRLEPLATYLLGELEDSFAHATAEDYARQAKWLALIEVVTVHFLGASTSTATPQSDADAIRSITTQVCERLVSVLTTHALAHQYKIIRQGAGRLLFILGAFALSPTNPLLSPSVIPLDALVAATALDWSSSAPAPSLEDTSEDDSDGVALRAKETAMHWLDNCRQFGDARDVAAVLSQLLPVALLSQNHPKAEVAVQAKNTTDAVAKALRLFELPQRAPQHAAATVDGLLDLLAAMARSATWKTRGAVIRFLMTFVFYHWVALTAAQKQRVHELIGSFLTDEQREVQAMAKFALRSLVHNESDEAVRVMSERLTAEAADARTRFPKQRRRLERLAKDEAATEEEVAQARARLRATEDRMTRSVLGMSAIVLAFPHETPALVPPMFEELGRFLYLQKLRSPAASFLEKAVKETLLEFRRTHQDNWQETKTRFSRAQLDVLEDVAIAPSYFS